MDDNICESSEEEIISETSEEEIISSEKEIIGQNSQDKILPNQISEPIKCSFCEVEFENHQKYILHNISFTKSNKQNCRVCGIELPMCFSMDKHMKTHPYCSVCKLVLPSKEKLIMHSITTHPSEVPEKLFLTLSHGLAKCYVCEKVFKDTCLAEIHTNRDHMILRAIFRK